MVLSQLSHSNTKEFSDQERRKCRGLPFDEKFKWKEMQGELSLCDLELVLCFLLTVVLRCVFVSLILEVAKSISNLCL